MSSDLNRSAGRFLYCVVALLGSSILLSILYLSASLFSVRLWSGGKSLDIYVHVFDAVTGDPISDATIFLFRGPPTPYDGPIATVILDLVSAENPEIAGTMDGPSLAVSDRTGTAHLAHRFRAGGQDSFLSRSGGVNTSGWWLRLSASGHSSIIVPLDATGRGRALDDDSPIHMTVGFSSAPPF